MSTEISRRSLLKRGGLLALGSLAPGWLSAVARADLARRAAGREVRPENVLVVCDLRGGNDGLNTVVPYASAEYYRLRPRLAVPESRVLPLDEHLGLHPALEGLGELWRDGQVAIVQGVGYPRPNRSHFKSQEIWQTASVEGRATDGWIGRHFDALSSRIDLGSVPAFGLSAERPLAFGARQVDLPCFASLADVMDLAGEPDVEKLLRAMQESAGPSAARVRRASLAALDTVRELRERLRETPSRFEYPDDVFGTGFSQIARLIAASPRTRVVYFAAGGFDTHARQPEQHERLLMGLGNALRVFQREMEAVGRAERVLVLVFSEFGRRAYENASLGTDHGAAAPVFLIGRPVRAGFVGKAPDLTRLEDGDVPFEIDFRRVYATLLDRWMGGDSGAVLGGSFEHLPVLRA